MDQILIIVPVASFEPLSVLKKSVECIYALEPGDMDVRVAYVLDLKEGDDPRLEYLQGVHSDTWDVVTRLGNRGRRAGAINDAIDAQCALSPDYIAIFDVDSRPEYDFLIECVRVLKSNESAIIASGARFVTNEDDGIVPKTIAAEYLFFSDVYEEFAIYDGFTHFNGLIGVIDMKLVNSYLPRSLDESVPCEDVEFTQRAYLAGLTSVFTPNTMVGEQAPVSIGDLFNQRVRWLDGAFAGLQKYRVRFFFALIPRTRKLAWLLALSLPFVAVLAIPFVPVYGLRLWAKHGFSRAVVQTAGLIGHTVLITVCGLVVIAKRIMGKETEWKDSSRSDV